MSKRISILKKLNLKQLAKDYEQSFEEKVCFEHLVTRDTPILELANHDSIFEYSTDYVDAKDPYLKENPIGNKDIKLKIIHQHHLSKCQLLNKKYKKNIKTTKLKNW